MHNRLYFAYGSNLHLEGMARRCPDSEPVGRASLAGWRLTFRGVADITPCEGARTHGVLWRLSDADLERLDVYEGYPSLYRRELLAVQIEEVEVSAVAYVMNDGYAGLPSASYFRSIKHGYEQWGLPLLALDFAVATVRNNFYDRGIAEFVSDGPKRLRPA